MQSDDETLALLREMRDVMVEQRNKYLEYLEKTDESYEKQFQRYRNGSYEQWTFMFVMIFAAVALAIWVTGASN